MIPFSVSSTDDAPWWQNTIVYQVYPRSFQDSDGNGVGDLRGLISRLDYFDYINVKTLWLSPIYQSPMVDFGYDVLNHTQIDPIFGTMSDFDELLRKMHEKGMKLILDFIPNHTSDKHLWFVESRKVNSTDNPFRDFYVWHDGRRDENGNRIPPNNWLSYFGGLAWEWDESRQQFYLHQFAKEQPDLNFRNPLVRRSQENVLRFWLDKGVDGFRVDAVLALFEDIHLRDEPRSFNPLHIREDDHYYLKHVYTQHQPEIHEVIAEWRTLLDSYSKTDGHPRFMVTEAYADDINEIIKYYHSGADMPFNFDLIYANDTCDGYCMRKTINNFLRNVPDGKWSNFVTGNHDRSRVSARFGEAYVDALNTLLLLLPGTPTTYYGEELGMEEVFVTFDETQDPQGKYFGKVYKQFSRDPVRSPMQWSSERNGGFSTASKTWLPVHPNYVIKNVQVEMERPFSHLNWYRNVSKLRMDVHFRRGTMKYSFVSKDILSFIRQADNDKAYLVGINLGKNMVNVDFCNICKPKDQSNAEFCDASGEGETRKAASTYGELRDSSAECGTGEITLTNSPSFIIGQKVPLNYISLSPGTSVIIQLVL
ncbi:hypothetical protein ACJMK2_043596 [Sinanodonta woodiana]|uniref:Glycosyl hydrolase family 13 catalytic domain-containing protein n=1 Tax=Sinanodonta woodiana TaxID=1069815 RepID=A0ABD3VXG3_SINWO